MAKRFYYFKKIYTRTMQQKTEKQPVLPVLTIEYAGFVDYR